MDSQEEVPTSRRARQPSLVPEEERIGARRRASLDESQEALSRVAVLLVGEVLLPYTCREATYQAMFNCGNALTAAKTTAAVSQKLSELALGTARWVESAVAQAHARLAARVVSVAEVALDELGSAAAGALGRAEGNAPQAERRRLQQRGSGVTPAWAAPQGGAAEERRERQLREGLPARALRPHLDPEETAAAAALPASPALSAPTQRFTAAAPFDLAGRALVFAPRGVTTYQACLEDNLPAGAPALPAASPGATHVDFDGDGVFSQSVQLSAPFHFFGQAYAELRVEASGRLIFGAGAAATRPPLGALDAHLATPGISALLVAAAE
eukprot:gene11186-13219_t